MVDNVSLFKPKARAKMHKETGALELLVPAPFGDGKHTVRLGINLMDAPIDALTEDPAGRKKLEQALFEALTSDIQVRGNNKSVETVPLFKALTDVVEHKMKDTM